VIKNGKLFKHYLFFIAYEHPQDETWLVLSDFIPINTFSQARGLYKMYHDVFKEDLLRTSKKGWVASVSFDNIGTLRLLRRLGAISQGFDNTEKILFYLYKEDIK
jgi:hypothetical protein